MNQRFQVKVRKNDLVSKYCIVDTSNDSHTIVAIIPDYLGQRKAFTYMLVTLLNTNTKFKLPKTLI